MHSSLSAYKYVCVPTTIVHMRVTRRREVQQQQQQRTYTKALTRAHLLRSGSRSAVLYFRYWWESGREVGVGGERRKTSFLFLSSLLSTSPSFSHHTHTHIFESCRFLFSIPTGAYYYKVYYIKFDFPYAAHHQLSVHLDFYIILYTHRA